MTLGARPSEENVLILTGLAESYWNPKSNFLSLPQLIVMSYRQLKRWTSSSSERAYPSPFRRQLLQDTAVAGPSVQPLRCSVGKVRLYLQEFKRLNVVLGPSPAHHQPCPQPQPAVAAVRRFYLALG